MYEIYIDVYNPLFDTLQELNTSEQHIHVRNKTVSIFISKH
jgi:hypothetical protein